CTSAPFSEPSGSMGTPGHTLNAWVAGSSAGRASVSMSGVVAAQRLPATVIAATAATAPIPNTAAARFEGPVFLRRRSAASRRRARSVLAVSCSLAASVGLGSCWSVIHPPCGASLRGNAQQQGDETQNGGNPPQPFAGRWRVFHGEVATGFGQFKGLNPFGIARGRREFFAIEAGTESRVGPFCNHQFTRRISVR